MNTHGCKRGDRGAYLGDDIPDLLVWHGHPATIYTVDDLNRHEGTLDVTFVGGPSMSISAKDAAVLDEETFITRGHRIISRQQPVADRQIPHGADMPSTHL